MRQINASIVLYHNKKEQVLRAIRSVLNTDLNVRLYLVDNSSNDVLKELAQLDSRITYIFNNANLGYGKAHNIAIRISIEDHVPYHLVLNPDVYFERGVLEELYAYMEHNKDIGNIMPQVRYPDGEIQYLCKLLPTPVDLIFRRFMPFKKWQEKRNEKYELRWTGYDKIMNVPYLSGCFMFLRTNVLQDIGMFDEQYFMYPEDLDLTRRIYNRYRNIFYPKVTIIHEHEKASFKNFKMMKIHILNMIKYFNKWGWIFDKEREKVNKLLLKELKYGEE
jgi:hypothetical protein